MSEENWLEDNVTADAAAEDAVTTATEDEAYVLGDEPVNSSINDDAEDPVIIL